MTDCVRRRHVLAAVVSGLTVGLAGCSDDEDDTEDGETDGGSGGY